MYPPKRPEPVAASGREKKGEMGVFMLMFFLCVVYRAYLSGAGVIDSGWVSLICVLCAVPTCTGWVPLTMVGCMWGRGRGEKVGATPPKTVRVRPCPMRVVEANARRVGHL